MGYNKKNLLIKIIDVQNLYIKHANRGVTTKWIFDTIIYPKFRISRATFYNYLATNAKKELKDLDEVEYTEKCKVLN